MKIKWQKAYQGPFKKLEAIGISQELRDRANPDLNGIYDARIRCRPKNGGYDVYIKTRVEKNMSKNKTEPTVKDTNIRVSAELRDRVKKLAVSENYRSSEDFLTMLVKNYEISKNK